MPNITTSKVTHGGRRRNGWTLEEYLVIPRSDYAEIRLKHHLDDKDPVPVEIDGDDISRFYGDEELRVLRSDIAAKAGFRSYAIYIVPRLVDVPEIK